MLIAFEIVLLVIMLCTVVYMVKEKNRRKQKNLGIMCIMAIIAFIVSMED